MQYHLLLGCTFLSYQVGYSIYVDCSDDSGEQTAISNRVSTQPFYYCIKSFDITLTELRERTILDDMGQDLVRLGNGGNR